MPKPNNKQTSVVRKLKPKRFVGVTTFTKKRMLIFVAIFGLIGGYLLWRSLAAPLPPTVYLQPASQTFAINTTFTVQVRENSSTTAVNAVQANFSYPATLVDFVSISSTGTAFTLDASSTGGTGQVSIARGTCTGCAAVTGDQLIATITFKTKTTGGAAAMAFVTGTALVSSTTNLNILPSLASTGGGTYTIDTVQPTVSVTAPVNGASISKGSTVTVSATATDADRVVSVDILIDGAVATTLTTSPYNYSWNTTSVAYGSHTIQAKAVDPSGNIGSSSVVTVTIADLTKPTVSITAPTAASSVKGTINIDATAADNSGGTGVTKVEFYVDGALKNTDTVAPYSYSWDTSTATNATHSLTATAYDGATPANNQTSAAVSVTVDNSAPTTPASFRTTGNTLNSIVLAWNASSDNTGVITGYRLTRAGSVIATTSGATLSYTDSALAAGTTYNYTIVALDAAGNASTAASLSASTVAATPGDVDGNSTVDITDLSILLSNWGTTNATCDFSKNGSVDIFDLSILLSHWTG